MILKDDDSNHKCSYLESCEIHSDECTDTFILNVSLNKLLTDNFSFNLKCPLFCKSPIMRYDSFGPTHKNSDENVPIYEQNVTTPHFHVFDENGIEVAYKTDKLKNADEAIALEDISLCVFHFFNEANIDYGNFELTLQSKELPFNYEDKNDPLLNVF